MDLEAEATVV
uniref:Uncharacterized protein n=1 Tax=Arundo donax TaxID=35708 RepID=A0A0A9BXD2_ARUDO